MPSRDFTKKHEDVYFTIDEDRFDCWPTLISDDLKAMGKAIGSGIEADNAVEKIDEVFAIVMQPESFENFRRRTADRRRPIDIMQIGEIIVWLTEVYTKRPTQPSSTSSSGSETDDGGSSSTDGAPVVEWTQRDLNPLGLPTSFTTT